MEVDGVLHSTTTLHAIPHNTTQYHAIPHNTMQHPCFPFHSSTLLSICLAQPRPKCAPGETENSELFLIGPLSSSSSYNLSACVLYAIPHNTIYTKPNYFSSSNCHLTIHQHVFHPGQDVANGQRRPRKLFFTVSELELGKRVAVAVAEPGQERIADPPTTRRHRSLS